jgi:phosphotransferase system enzyme I (PtsI)
MTLVNGQSVSTGYAEGIAWAWVRPSAHDWSRADIAGSAVKSERQRFDDSVDATIDELKLLGDRTTAELGAEQAAIFRAQIALLSDRCFVQTVAEHISCRRRTAEHALVSVVDDWVNGAAALTDEHSREQAMDVRDLAQRVMSHLSGRSGIPFAPPPEDSILVASELLPSDVMELDWSGVLAAVTERGGPTSHASILVRSLGIPAVTGLTGIRDLTHQGEELLVNGELGVVFLEPSVEETVLFGSQRAHYQQVVKSLTENEAEPCTTLDGVQVSLYANISNVGEVADVIAHHILPIPLHFGLESAGFSLRQDANIIRTLILAPPNAAAALESGPEQRWVICPRALIRKAQRDPYRHRALNGAQCNAPGVCRHSWDNNPNA